METGPEPEFVARGVNQKMVDLLDMHRASVKLLLNPREAAAALSICERTLWELTAAGEIPAIRIPGRGKARSLRYAVDDLRDWIHRLKQSPVAPAGLKDTPAQV